MGWMLVGVGGSMGLLVALAFGVGGGRLSQFLDFYSLLLVLGLALFATLARLGQLSSKQLAELFGESAVVAGWIGLFLGLILVFSHGDLLSENGPSQVSKALAVAVLPPFYGYVIHLICRMLPQVRPE